MKTLKIEMYDVMEFEYKGRSYETFYSRSLRKDGKKDFYIRKKGGEIIVYGMDDFLSIKGVKDFIIEDMKKRDNELYKEGIKKGYWKESNNG